MDRKLFGGIDPGQYGGIGILDQAGQFVEAHRWDLKRPADLFSILLKGDYALHNVLFGLLFCVIIGLVSITIPYFFKTQFIDTNTTHIGRHTISIFNKRIIFLGGGYWGKIFSSQLIRHSCYMNGIIKSRFIENIYNNQKSFNGFNFLSYIFFKTGRGEICRNRMLNRCFIGKEISSDVRLRRETHISAFCFLTYVSNFFGNIHMGIKIHKDYFNSKFNICGWSCTDVLKLKTNMNTNPPATHKGNWSYPDNPCIYNFYPGSLSGSQCFISNFRTFFSCVGSFLRNVNRFFHVPGMFLRSFIQRISKQSDYYGSQSHNYITININPFNDTMNSLFSIKQKRHEKRERYFRSRTIIFLLGLILIYLMWRQGRRTK